MDLIVKKIQAKNNHMYKWNVNIKRKLDDNREHR